MEELDGSCKALAAAVLLQAFRDMRSGNGEAGEAASWLYHSELAGLILDVVGLDTAKLPDAITAVLDGASLCRVGRRK